MKIIIDVREHALIQEIEKDTQFPFPVEKRQLELGDIIICDEQSKPLLLIERKTPADLVSSIKDGRYAEQSTRLQAHELHNHNIMYLIEGNAYFHKDINILISAMYSLYFYKGFSIWQSLNIKTTKQLIERMATKMQKEKNKNAFYNYACSNITPVDYVNCIKTTKKDNITEENIHQIMLAQIPNVSISLSKIVLEKYGTIFKLKVAIDEDKTCLDNLMQVTSTGKARKISSLAINSILRYFS
jgi:ERCC4-type nuclease